MELASTKPLEELSAAGLEELWAAAKRTLAGLDGQSPPNEAQP